MRRIPTGLLPDGSIQISGSAGSPASIHRLSRRLPRSKTGENWLFAGFSTFQAIPDSLLPSGHSLLGQGEAILDDQEALVGDGQALLPWWEALVGRGETLLDDREALVRGGQALLPL